MIVDRRTFRVKFGQGVQAAEWIKEQIEGNTFYTEAYRIYLPDIGVEYDEVVVEWEYEDVPAMRAAWKAWWARPSTEEAVQKWNELAAPGGHTEIWQLFAKR